MSIFVEAASIIEAFLFRSSPDSIEEFKPTGSELSLCLSKLLRCTDAKIRVTTVLALHIHYQSTRLLNVSDQDLLQYRSLLAKLVSELLKSQEYMLYYCKATVGDMAVMPSELNVFIHPFLAPETILNILHGKVTVVNCPQLEVLFKFAQVDLDASQYIMNNCFVVYELITNLTTSLLSGKKIDDEKVIKKYELKANCLNQEFDLLLRANMKRSIDLQKKPITCGRKLNLERVAKGYLNPSWDWMESQVDPSVRFVYEYLRVDKPQYVRRNVNEELEFKGSLELSSFHSQYMNIVTGKMFGCAPILAATFPKVLPESFPVVHFDSVIKLNGIVQQATETVSTAFKEWSSFFVNLNETLRLLNQENQQKLDAVWLFRNKPNPITVGYAGLLFGCGLKGLLKELPLVAIMDFLKSGNQLVQSTLLLGLGLSYHGQYVESIDRILSMHIRSHFMNTVKIQISAQVQGAALLGYGFMYYNSCDRQALKTLFTEFQRTGSQHEKTTIGYPPSFYLNVGIAIGMVSSGDFRNCLSTSQLDSILSTANGHDNDRAREYAAVLALLLGALGTGDTALASCVSMDDKLNIPPLLWFMKRLCRLCIEWSEKLNFDLEWTDEYSFYDSAAFYLYSAIRCRPDTVNEQLPQSMDRLYKYTIKATEGLAFKRIQSARDFAMDCCLLSLCILENGSKDARILRHLARSFSSTLDYNHGRAVTHSLAAGFLCLQADQRLDLSEHFSISAILISTIPLWIKDFADMTMYFMPLRYLWAMAITNHTPSVDEESVCEPSSILCENAIFQAFRHNQCPWSEQQLAEIFKKT